MKKNMSQIVELGFLMNPIVPWLGFSPDGIICVNNTLKLWENKTASGKAAVGKGADTLCYFVNYMEGGKLRNKHKYYGQVQLGMLLTSTLSCDFTVYCYTKKEIYVDSIMFNEKFCLDMVDALTKVYFSHILLVML